MQKLLLGLFGCIPMLLLGHAANLHAETMEVSKTTHRYKKVGTLEILADVYSFRDDKRRPVVVWLHGGALINGNREGPPKWLAECCRESGYVLVSLDYRLAPETQLPGIIEDVEDAFRWIREAGPKLFQADPKRIGVCGGSAGGYLTLTAGFRVKPPPQALVSLWGYGDLVGDWYSKPSPHPRHHTTKLSAEEAWKQVQGPPLADAKQRPGNGGAFYQFCRQQGVWPKAVSGWDPHTQAEKFHPFMPAKNVTRDYPPTFLIHGDKDTDVPVEQSDLMVGEFKRLGVEHHYLRIAGGEHGLPDVERSVVEDAYRQAAEFLKKQLGAPE